MFKIEDLPVGVSEVSIILNVKPDTVSSWQLRNIMPTPDAYINKGRTRLWRVQTVIEWANATNRNKANIGCDDAWQMLGERKFTAESYYDKPEKFTDEWGSLGDYSE